MNAADLLARHAASPPAGAPTAEHVVRPPEIETTAHVLRAASESGLRVLIWGAGGHQGRGDVEDPDVLLLTEGLRKPIEYEPEDLTIVVGGGTTLDEIDEIVTERGQTAVLPETDGAATIGGVIAAGLSGWRRLRYGPTRDRVLETVLVTGDGRVVKGGGRVVKNVTGYDIPKLATGSLGALGVIGSVCLKLWPRPRAERTVLVGSPAEADAAYRPFAVIETERGTTVLLGGPEREVEAEVSALGGVASEGLQYPDPLDADLECTLLVEPRLVAAGVAEIRTILPGATFQAAHGVGEIRTGATPRDVAALSELRSWAERMGGSLIRTNGTGLEPWGTPPPDLELQRRVKLAFDPRRVCNPGRLPGGL